MLTGSSTCSNFSDQSGDELQLGLWPGEGRKAGGGGTFQKGKFFFFWQCISCNALWCTPSVELSLLLSSWVLADIEIELPSTNARNNHNNDNSQAVSHKTSVRSWWRHEQQSIREALATVSHHSFGQVHTARDVREDRHQGRGRSLEDEELPAARRLPAALAEPRGGTEGAAAHCERH